MSGRWKLPLWRFLLLLGPMVTALGLAALGSNTGPAAALELEAVVSPPANDQGWHRTPVSVKFKAVGNSSPIKFISPSRLLTSDTNEAEVVGVVMDSSGHSATNYAWINIDRTPPDIRLKEGGGPTFDNSFRLVIVEFTDQGWTNELRGSGVDLTKFQSTLNGQAITNIFTLVNGRAVALLPSLAAGPHILTVSVRDHAGNLRSITNSFTATGALNPLAPVISEVCLTDDLTLTPSEQIWLQGKVSGEKSTVRVVVNGVSLTELNRREQFFGGIVSFGSQSTNSLALIATDVGGANRSAQLYRTGKTDAFQVELDQINLGCGNFTNGKPQPLGGAVSERFRDESLDLGLASVKVNGLTATLSQVVSNGLVRWSGVTVPAPTCDNSIVPIIISMCWTGITSEGRATNLCVNLPSDYLDSYEIVDRTTRSAEYRLTARNPGPGCRGNQWLRTDSGVETETTFQLPCAKGPNVTVLASTSRSNSACSAEEANFDGVAHEMELAEETTQQLPVAERGLALGYEETISRFNEHATGDDAWQIEGKLVVEDGSITYRMPFGAREEPHIVTFDGVTGVVLTDLEFMGQKPIASDEDKGTVSYLLVLNGGKEFKITADSFRCTGSSTNSVTEYPRDSSPSGGKKSERRSETRQLLRFKEFRQ